MAVAAYTTDLADIADFDTTGGTAVEPASLWTSGRSPAEDDGDNPIQGTVHGSLVMNTTGKAGMLVPGETVWASGEYIFGWVIWQAPGAIATYAAGGLAMILGDSASVFNVYYVGGKDYGLYPIGGWQNFAVDPELTPDENAGSPTSFTYVGGGANVLTQVSKGAPLNIDVFRSGRGEARVAGGTSTDADADFDGLAAANDNTSNRWGLFQKIEGGFKMKGKLVIGFGAACDFTDSDKNIYIDRTDWVDADFNRIELTNASSNINWTNINITCLDPVNTASRGRLEMMDDCPHNDTGGVYTDLDTFIYDSNADIVGRTWRRCNNIIQGGATITDCEVDQSTAAIAMTVDSLGLITGTKFKSSGTGHAADLGNVTTTQSMDWDNTDTGYALQGGTAANRTILVNVSTSQTLTINVAAGASSPTYYNTGAGDVVIAASVQLTMVVKNSSGTPINGARAYIDDNNTVPFIMDTTTNASGIATVGHSGGTVTGATWRVRLYGYKQFYLVEDIGSSDKSIPVTLVADPQQT